MASAKIMAMKNNNGVIMAWRKIMAGANLNGSIMKETGMAKAGSKINK
jgi:hypothetical protein